MQHLRPAAVLWSLLALLALASACKSDPVGPGSDRNIRGVVTDDAGRPLPDVTVNAHGKSAVTDEQGLFELEKVESPDARTVVTASRAGYFSGAAGFVPGEDKNLFVRITLMEKLIVSTFDVSAGGNSELDNGARVEIPANAVRRADGSAYSGSVEVALAHLDPTSPDFASLVAGGDLQAERTDGTDASLYSYGILRVELQDPSGNELQLGTGSSATIRVPVPASMQGGAPATIPLWYLDEETGIWMEEGQATLQGDAYVGTVTHFTDWNCDVPEGTGTVTGRVVDCNGDPLPNLPLAVGQGAAFTDANGNFTRRVPANTPFSISSGGDIVTFPPVSVPGIAEGQTVDVGTITATCPAYIRVTLARCSGNLTLPVYIRIVGETSAVDFWAEEASFDLPAALGQSITLLAWDFQGNVASATVETGAAASSVNADLVLCGGIVLTPTTVILDGGPFANQRFTLAPVVIFGFSTATGIFSQSSQTTDLSIVANSGYAALSFGDIPGKQPGTFPIGGASGISAAFQRSDSSASSSSGEWLVLSDPQSGTLVIDRYEQVGGKISGSFDLIIDGDRYNPATQTSTPLTGIRMRGTFEALRGDDE
ncbi:MAG: carboxypeptidase regulatory-like domain-containing protein [Bacteroidia bacterium]|nr:carboxypeptidase regulatory-like domain-containing protein [Bacteroidia bacterium]